MTYFFETYGCQMNSAESAAMDLVFRERGWQRAATGESADLVLLNTCSVRETAEKRVLGRVALYESMKKKRPFTLIAAGCMAERLGEGLKTKAPGIDFVLGTARRSQLSLILEALEQGAAPACPSVAKPMDTLQPDEEKPVFAFSPFHFQEPAAGERTIRSFVPIMQGCNNFCSYCIVPYVRGREASREPAAILEEIRLLGERGIREITLLGQNVNSYSLGTVDFSRLLETIAAGIAKTGIKWVRFLSANPRNFSSRTIQVLADNPAFCRHLHLCVQHGSDRVLQGMNRGYTRKRYLDLVDEIRQAMPDITFSTDILIGFPGETEEDLAETLTLMDQVRFLYAYMYHYNPREGTAAYSLPNRIDAAVKGERLSRVIALQGKHTRELLLGRLGSREQVLVEGISRKNADELIARTTHDEMVAVPGGSDSIGTFGELTLSALKGNTFHAEAIECFEY